MRSGSTWYFLALDLIQRTAAFTSWTWAGNASLGQSRYWGRDRHISAPGEFARDRPDVGLVPLSPGAAVNHDDRREQTRRLLPAASMSSFSSEIAGLGVDDVLLLLDLRRLAAACGVCRRPIETEKQTHQRETIDVQSTGLRNRSKSHGSRSSR